MIDTHCHLDVEAFDDDRDAALARATAAGVQGILVPAIRPSTWDRVAALVRPGVRVAFGVHPQVVPELAAGETDDLEARLAASTGAAIGECGLDGGTAAHDEQERIFRAHIRAARAAQKPLVVHVLRAHDAAPRILREERAHDCGGVLHSYSGGADLVPVYRDLGFAFSFAGPITYANARRPLEAARSIPRELLLVETDAPDQAPASHRGTRSEPAYLPEIVAGLAGALGEPVEAIAALVTANARRIFGDFS